LVLGRGLGLSDQQLQHLKDATLPDDVYTDAQAAIIRYAQKSTRLETIDDKTYGDLEVHFNPQQIIDICLTVGLSNMVNRFHATFKTDIDDGTLSEVEDGNDGVSPLAIPGTADKSITTDRVHTGTEGKQHELLSICHLLVPGFDLQ